MMSSPSTEPSAWSVLRRFARPRPAIDRCELCGAPIPPDHPHLVEPAARRLVCGCNACALLFGQQQGGRLRRVEPRVEALDDLRLSDAQWDDLRLPIQLAFFLHSTPAGRVVAVYPSPAGATESLLSLEAWDSLVADNPALGDLAPDVEALLVNRVDRASEAYRVSIDECYKLVGLIRTRWRGLSGGADVWEEIGRFFADLRRRSSSSAGGVSTHAGPELPGG
jgi:hypothetical protein